MNHIKLRNLLNNIFLVLAVLSIIFYFTFKDDFSVFLYTCIAAIFVKLIEFFLRFSGR